MRDFVLKYWNDRKKRVFTRHFKTFKEAFDHAMNLGLDVFDIDGVTHYYI